MEFKIRFHDSIIQIKEIEKKELCHLNWTKNFKIINQ